MIEKLVFFDFVKSDQMFYMADLLLKREEETLPHFHDFYEFQIILEGHFAESWNGKELYEKKRCSHLLCPSDIHCLKGLQETNLLRNIAVRTDVMTETLHLFGLESNILGIPFLLNETSLILFRQKTENLFRITDVRKRNAVFLNVLYDFLYSFLSPEDRIQDIPGWLSALKQEMEKEENFLAGLPRMIEICGLTREHIGRSFKQYYGITPSAFLYQCRLMKAASLLISEKDSILNIALESGFDNFSYFHKLFQKHFGMSPKEYRKKSHRLFIQ